MELPPLPLDRLEDSPQRKTAIHRGRMIPTHRRDFEALNRKDFLAFAESLASENASRLRSMDGKEALRTARR